MTLGTPARDRHERVLAYEVRKLDQAAVPVAGLGNGERIHIGQHDIFRRDLEPLHKDTAEADITVDAVVFHGSLAVIMGHAGTALYAVAYDRDDTVTRAA